MECWISVQAEVNGNANTKRSNFLILLNWDRLSVPRRSFRLGPGEQHLRGRTSWSLQSNIARWLCSTIAGPVCADHLNPERNTFAWKRNSSRLRIMKNACRGCVRTGVFRMLRTCPFHPLGPRAEDA